MKKTTLLFMLLCSGFLLSCSNDIDDNADNTTVIAKSINYVPQMANFETKTVGYYDTQNRKVLDSVFDANEVFLRKIITTYTPQLITAKTYDASDVLTKNYTEEFDTAGRLLTTTFYDGVGTITSKYTFDYNDVDHTITKYTVNGAVSTAGFVYTLNSSGVLYHEENPSGEVRYFEFENGKPKRLVFQEIDDPASWPTYTYYPTIRPANFRSSTTERNNIALKSGLEHIAYNWDHYYSAVSDYFQVQMTFNENNYPLTAHYTVIPSPSLGEIFYYY